MRDEREYVIEVIGTFLNGSCGELDWDQFTSRSLRSARLDGIRRRAGTIALPLDAGGEALLKHLLDEAEHLSEYDLTKPKPWPMEMGFMCGFLVGALLWWSGYVDGGGLFQNPQLILVPAAVGVLIVSLRNRRERVGYYDPDIIAQNKRGRI